MLADLTWGTGLLGIGVVTSVAQLARLFFVLSPEAFWVLEFKG
jgi:hypothetical protein